MGKMKEPTALYIKPGALFAGALLLVLAVFCLFSARYWSADYYEDGTYRGIFADGDSIQVNVEFGLRGGRVERARFRHLRRDENYFLGTDEEPYRSVIAQYAELLSYLEGKDLRSSLGNLYSPENIITVEVDGYTAATVRSSKVISAVRDGLNRGVYSY